MQYDSRNEQKIMKPQYQTKVRPLGKVIQFQQSLNPDPIYPKNKAQKKYSNNAMKIYSNSVDGRPTNEYRGTLLSLGTTTRILT